MVAGHLRIPPGLGGRAAIARRCQAPLPGHLDPATANGARIGFVPPSSLTLGEYQTYVGGLPAANPNSIESKTAPVGQGATAPSAENVTTLPVSPTEVVPTVKPASQVGPTDAVIDPNAPAPAGPQPSSPFHANDDDDHDHDDQSGWISDAARGIDQLRRPVRQGITINARSDQCCRIT